MSRVFGVQRQLLGSLPCRRMSSNARRHGSVRTAASIDTSMFISSSEADELSLPLLIKLQLPKQPKHSG